MIKLFRRRRPHGARELAPQLTSYDRRALDLGVVPTGALGYGVYDQMQRDSMIQTALTLKKLGVLSAPTRIVAANEGTPARRNADFAEEAFARMEGTPHSVLLQAMDAFAKGWSVQELVYEPEGSHVWLKAVRGKDPGLFGLEVDAFGRIAGLTLRLPGESPRNLPRSKFVVFAHRGGYGRVTGRSDLDAAYAHWQAKTALLMAWKHHLERYASPTVIGRFERGLPVQERADLLATLERLHQHTAMTYPKEIEIDTLGGTKEASTGFMEAIDFHNREMARAILGQTLTTDEGRRVGSMALGKVHLQVLIMQLDALRRELADTVLTEQVIRPLIELNFGPGNIPRFEFEPAIPTAFATGVIQ